MTVEKELKLRIAGWSISVLLIPIVFGIMLITNGVEAYGINVGATVLALVIAYVILSLGYVQTGEKAMITLFGDPIGKGDICPGLYLALLGIVQVRKVASTLFQDELPADPEKIFRDEGKVPEGMFPPNRIKFGPPPKEAPTDPDKLKIHNLLKDSPYYREMVAEVPIVVAWQVESATGFFKKVGSVEVCRRMLNDISVDTFGDDFAKITPAQAAFQNRETAKEMLIALRAKVTDWHITIHDGYVKPFIYGHHLNEAVEQVSVADLTSQGVILKAKGDAKAVEITADAEKERLVRTGLAKLSPDGKNIVELIPDAITKANTDAFIKGLTGHKGAVVLGETSTMLNIGSGGKK